MKLRLILVTALLLASSTLHLAWSRETPQGSCRVVRLRTAVALDGSASEWTAVPPTPLSGPDGRASVRFGYDAANFYAFVEVVDPSPLRNAAARPQEMLKGGDALAFYFNDPKAGPQRVLVGILEGKTLIYAHRPKWKEKQPYVFSSPVGSVSFDFVAALPDAKAVLIPTATGYVAELSLPWASLGFKPSAAPFGFDFQVIYSDPAGAVNVGALWLFSSGPGLTVEDLPSEARLYPDAWGEAVLAETAPAADPVAVSRQASRSPAAATLQLDLPRDGRLTLSIMDERGWIYRELIRAEPFTAGKHTISWDGRDRYGDVMPAGNYRWKALLFDGVGMKFLGSVGNSARPPFRTEDGLGSLGGQHGDFGTVAADEGGIYIGGGLQEGEPSFRKINATSGAALWKRSPGSFQSVVAVTADEGMAVLLNSKGKKPNTQLVLVQVDPISGQTVTIGGKSEIELDAPAQWGETADVAIAGGRAYFSVPRARRIGGIHLTSGAKLPDIALEAWGLQRFDANTLLACTKDSVVRLDLTTGRVTPIIAGLVAPRDVTMNPKTGDLFVSELGSSQQIKKFSAEGKLLATFGRVGGKPSSMPIYDPLAFNNVISLVCGPDGNLWMKEASPTPKRFVRLTTDGRWLEDICGPVAYNTFGPDLDDPATIFYNPNTDTSSFIEAKVDYSGYAADPAKPGNWRIVGIHDLSLGADESTVNPLMAKVAQNGYGHIIAFKASNGKRFLFRLSKFNRASAPAGAGLWIWEKHRWIPALFIAGDANDPSCRSWRDANGDGLIQEDEYFVMPHVDRYSWIDRDMTLQGLDGLLKPSAFDSNGLPVYEKGSFVAHVKEPSPYLADGNVFASATVDGSVYYGVNWGPHRHLAFWDRATDNRLIKVTNGVVEWMTGIHASNGGFTEFSTISGIAGIVDDIVLVHNVEPSSFIAYTTDGLVLGDAACNPDGKKPGVGPTAVYIEHFTGLFVKDEPTGRRLLFFVVSGDDRIVELTGPGRTARFEGKISLATGSASAGAGVPIIPYSSWYGNVSRGLGIDGYDTEWEPSVPRISVSRPTGPVADVRFRRDAGSLFIMADILDSTPFEAGEGIALDLGRTALQTEVTLGFSAPPPPIKGKWKGNATLHRKGVATDASGIQVAASLRWENLGYRLEAEVPLSLLPEFASLQTQTFRRDTIDPRTGKPGNLGKQTQTLPDLVSPLFLNVRLFLLENGAPVQTSLTSQKLISVSLP